MPFRQFTDPDQLAHVEAAFRAAVVMIEARSGETVEGRNREHLAYLVSGLFTADPNADIASLAAHQFLNAGGAPGAERGPSGLTERHSPQSLPPAGTC